MINGIFNYCYDFFYSWFFGTNPNTVLLPYAESLATISSLLFIVAILVSVVSVCTYLFKVILTFWRR